MNTIDLALIEAIAASSTTNTNRPKRTGKSCQLVPVVTGDEPVHAQADRSKWVPFVPLIYCRGIGSSLHV